MRIGGATDRYVRLFTDFRLRCELRPPQELGLSGGIKGDGTGGIAVSRAEFLLVLVMVSRFGAENRRRKKGSWRAM